MQPTKTHWASLLTLIVLGLGIPVLWLIAFGMGVSSLINLFTGESSPAAEMIGAASFFFLGLTLCASAWFVLQKVLKREQADQFLHIPFAWWQAAVVIGLVVFGLGIGSVIAVTEIAWLGWLTLPMLTILVIVAPIWLVFGMGSNGLETGPRWRFFAVFGLGLTAGPLLIILLELIILILALLGVGVYLAVSQPSAADELMQLAQTLSTMTNEEDILNLLAPYITNPALIASALGFIALIVPLIEELLKPLGVWLFAKRIESPAQGFILGLLSGAAFALFESLNASADGSVGWAAIAGARAGTSVLHITASGLVGWGIVSAFKEKRIGRLAASYIAAVLIHGVWNAAAAGTGIAALGETVGRPEWLFMYAPALLCGLLVMGVGMFAVLLASNRKLRRAKEKEQVQLSA